MNPEPKSKYLVVKHYLNKLFFGPKWKRNIFVLFLFACAFYFVYTKFFKSQSAVSYEYVKVQKKDIEKTVEGSGKVVSVSELDIQQLSGGKITNVYVKPGDYVKRGQIIARLDSRQAAIQVAQAKANYDKVVNGSTDTEMEILKVALDNAKSSYDLTKKAQDLNVQIAKRNLLNSSTQAVAQYDSRIVANNPTISGSYTCDNENEYHIVIQGTDIANISDNNGGFYTVNVSSVPQAIGSCGLYISFDSTKNYGNGDWKITLPNKQATNYSSNLNSYNSALQARDTQLNQASTSVASAYLNLQQKIVGARSEDIRAAKASLDQANLTYENTIIRAPFDGQIGSVSASVGQQTSTQQGVATIITNTKFAEISLNEIDIVNVKLGQEVNLKLDAVPDKTFKGVVSQINTVGVQSSNVTSFGVKISINDSNERIKSGMSVTANIIVEGKKDILTIPASAIRTKNNKATVSVKTDIKGKNETRLIETGISNDIDTEVISGLSEGEEVLYKTNSSSTSKTQTTFSLFGGGGGRPGGR